MEDRRRLAAPELTQWVKKIKNKMTSLPPMGDFQDPRADFRHGFVLRLRLSRREREMLEVAAADEDGPPSPLPAAGQPGLAKQVAVLLFLRWSFAHHTLRELLSQLGEAETDSASESSEFGDGTNSETSWGWHPAAKKSAAEKEHQSALLKSFAVGLATRLDYALPFDARRERVKELLSDPENVEFWDNYQNCHGSMARELDNDNPEKFAVAPIPEDEKIWLGLANKVIKTHHVMCRWPGVHEAAAFAAQALGIRGMGPEYPFIGTWFKRYLTAISQATAHKGRPNIYAYWICNGTGQFNPQLIRNLGEFRCSADYPEYEEDWVQTVYASVDAADVWDVWTLLRMIQCESASREITASELRLLRAAQYQAGPPDLKKECSPAILDLKEYVDIARYNSPEYQLRPVTSKTTITELLEKAGLDTTGNWDLLALTATKQAKSFSGQLWSLGGHYRHVFYLTDDVTSHYLGNNRDLLGLNIPCKCNGCDCPGYQNKRPGRDTKSKTRVDFWMERIELSHHTAHCKSHHGGDGQIVFARRKLDPALLHRILERYWIDWNDCMLIFGRGDDGRGNLIDGKTLYLLETLPGMKLRGLKRKTTDEARGLASACLYLNLKLDHQYEGTEGRNLLKSIMRERYHPRFSDFTCLIQRRDAGINWDDAAFFSCGRYGSTYGVPWSVGRRYDQFGNVCYNRYETGIALIRIIANSDGESRIARDNMFCNRLESFYDYVAGNRFKNVVHFYGFMSVPVKTIPSTGSNRPAPYKPEAAVPGDRAFAFVFEHTKGPLLDFIEDMVDDCLERETWLAIFNFLHEIGTTLRDMHATIGPYRYVYLPISQSSPSIPCLTTIQPSPTLSHPQRSQPSPTPSHPPTTPSRTHALTLPLPKHPDPSTPPKILLRPKRSRLRAADFNIPHLHDRYAAPRGSPAPARFEAVLGEPTPVPRRPRAYIAPELRRAGNRPDQHTAATDAYAFARYALDLIDRASGGLFAGLGLGGRTGDVRVLYVEVLKGLEDVLAAEGGVVASSSASGGGGGGVDPRTKAMDNFLQLAKDVVSGGVILDGHYPVPESSHWY
ncbi:predicted protein [Chaetomium globosum CBS 148.51]|uniref:Uncharacterized protein n=1 Tax=Chaetomium globosum (strain ATCC 6205 / CBS 148.51 / DSM 1962 / NBRC 6347 / NRRL 1970) TaxID=306901 RepID=Q2H233_CHAGB|nr:uncharacterized protein CHGG_04163 [Chaetomium globosum CBS 148.51]EAQ87544.1 predicted protein [Chaetomium globosum CBS 148.51]